MTIHYQDRDDQDAGHSGKAHVRTSVLTVLMATGVLLTFQYHFTEQQLALRPPADGVLKHHDRESLLEDRLDALELANKEWEHKVGFLSSELEALKRKANATDEIQQKHRGRLESEAPAPDDGKDGKADKETSAVQRQQHEEATGASKDDTESSDTPADNPAFPETQFTPHVKELLRVIENLTLHNPENGTESSLPFNPHRYCNHGYRILVDQPYTPPSVLECSIPHCVWCRYFQQLFGHDPTLVLPYNVSVGMSMNDMIYPNSGAYGQCFGSSAPNGLFSMNNFQDASANLGRPSKNSTGHVHHHALPWEQRHTIPVFRGHPRTISRTLWKQDPQKHCAQLTIANGDFGHRSLAVLFSVDHPDLLDARLVISRLPNAKMSHECIIYNATNGMDKVFEYGNYSRDDKATIPSSQYYTDYQVSVVLGGIGAAFRTPTHLSAGQAVVLQRFIHEEWYVPYMTPYMHYIPLKNDMSDLQQILEWVRDNPIKVKVIAENGKRFYDEWLSFPQTDQHWHEVLWRLSQLLHYQGPEWLKTGEVRTIWPNPIVPMRFIREDATGLFVPEERSKSRQPYVDYDSPRGDSTNE